MIWKYETITGMCAQSVWMINKRKYKKFAVMCNNNDKYKSVAMRRLVNDAIVIAVIGKKHTHKS